MSLFSSLRKNRQVPPAEDSAYLSRAESDSTTTRPRKRKSASRADGGPVDPVLPEKKRARRRLVGAIALVLAVVIGLPMVLDSEPKPLADDVTIDIPSKDKPAAPASALPAPAAPVPAVPPKSGSADGASRVVPAAALDPREELVQLPAVPKAAALAKLKTEPSATFDSEKASGKGAEKPAPRLMENSVEKSVDTARAKAILEAGAGTNATKFTVQVAALASVEKVNELRGKLKDAGMASYTQKVATDNGERIRIRIGPLNSRDEADKVRAKLTSLGLNGTVVPPSL